MPKVTRKIIIGSIFILILLVIIAISFIFYQKKYSSSIDRIPKKILNAPDPKTGKEELRDYGVESDSVETIISGVVSSEAQNEGDRIFFKIKSKDSKDQEVEWKIYLDKKDGKAFLLELPDGKTPDIQEWKLVSADVLKRSIKLNLQVLISLDQQKISETVNYQTHTIDPLLRISVPI